MNGTINFHSENNEICVYVEIPIKSSNIFEVKINLLIVDDFPGIRSTKLLLETYGFTVHLAKSGEEAIELCKINSYNIILMDKNMNGLSGIETVRLIRTMNNKKVIIYGFTGDTMSEEENSFKCSINGVNDILYKPLDINTLIESYNRDKVLLHPLL